ncbi:uncharacterized protein BXZ73DRAFT_43357 [Epithele typhae]|uniref:uncharacterized protein n=1 Tax=Epithele typhae TaxID=378194 RepID=UPI0020087DA8|nr:uncharacterized protein BXZ73DRAFT_43357 [Epithele typhae]KAH9939671.1 hypothetical protein BXZ73DRAFT_43357 [Epithele typhae]
MVTLKLPVLLACACTVLAAATPLAVITPAPRARRDTATPGADITTLPVASCLASVECCQQTVSLPVLPASFTTLLSGVTVPVPVPTLGPLAGVTCSSATALDIVGNQCLQGGTPVCCQEVLLGGWTLVSVDGI